MYLTGTHPADGIEEITGRLQQLTRELLSGMEFTRPAVTYESLDDLHEHFDRDSVFLVLDGIIELNQNGETVISYEEGDLIGLTQAFHQQSPVLSAEGYVELQPIERDLMLRHIYSDPRRQHCWSHLLITSNALLTNHLARVMPDERVPAAGFLNFVTGENIINQGDEADMVYTIISGEADVLVDGVNVGTLGEDEVFGAMAVFTKEPRTATVRARTPCSVMAVPKEDFNVLIQAQPQAALNLIENLARRISIMNQQLLEQTGSDKTSQTQPI